jgi:hypothetical protein
MTAWIDTLQIVSRVAQLLLLMPSTPSAYPQGTARSLASFRVLRSAFAQFTAILGCVRFPAAPQRKRWSEPQALASFSFSSTSHQQRSSELTSAWRGCDPVRFQRWSRPARARGNPAVSVPADQIHVRAAQGRCRQNPRPIRAIRRLSVTFFGATTFRLAQRKPKPTSWLPDVSLERARLRLGEGVEPRLGDAELSDCLRGLTLTAYDRRRLFRPTTVSR